MGKQSKQPKLFTFGPCSPWFYKKELTVGQVWMVRHFGRWRACQVIQVTRKGFNLLDLATSRCILHRHLYAQGFSGKPLPPERKTYKFNIPEWIVFGDKVNKESIG